MKSRQDGPRVKFFGFRLGAGGMLGFNSMGIYNLETTHRYTLTTEYVRSFHSPIPPFPLRTHSPAPPPSIHTVIYWGPSKIHIILHRDIYHAATCSLLSRAFSQISLFYHFLLIFLFRHAEEKELRPIEGDAQGKVKCKEQAWLKK